MRKYQNLEGLLKGINIPLDKQSFADLLADDLKQAHCQIFGETIDEELVLLAELKTQDNSISYSSGIFRQSIAFVVAGHIISNEYPAITYRVDTGTFQFYGRCSTIPQVCGVDLYLDKSYTQTIGDYVKQKFTIPVNQLYRSVQV
ncbi:MAG: hypothetical protein HFP77_00995 [Methylococcales symbiont of Iophon sp. n. MRB-2018]|nr:MAG: hypothetical protein HFP77_00995 [Methylococcales symbiont of Iophon sp. n. MRB-2018]KAF3980708.1 MAG: hypothetical protein HFP76_00670 [Methylococcales symbiont of Iophon sp. n. MRB-2018]